MGLRLQAAGGGLRVRSDSCKATLLSYIPTKAVDMYASSTYASGSWVQGLRVT